MQPWCNYGDRPSTNYRKFSGKNDISVLYSIHFYLQGLKNGHILELIYDSPLKQGMLMKNSVQRLEQAAIKLFSRSWYASISIAEICREAGLSNGIFYRYFKDKDALIVHLLEKTIQGVCDELSSITGNTVHERLVSMVEHLFAYAQNNPDLVRVFREGQYRFVPYERKLVELYKKTLSMVLGRPVSIADYLFVFGGIRFASIRNALYAQPMSLDTIVACVEHGIFKGQTYNSQKVFSLQAVQQPVSFPDASRERIIAAGKTLFGSINFSDVSVYKIAEQAGLSVGAFYKYFESKERFFSEIIELSGKEIRHFIAANLSSELNRLEREIQGLLLFGTFLSLDRSCYNIVREGEFIVPEKTYAYYAAFEESYRKLGTHGINQTILTGNSNALTTVINFLLGIAHYYGIELAFDESIKNSRSLLDVLAVRLQYGIYETIGGN